MAHGDLDQQVPAADARHFADRLRQTSASPVVYAELRGGNHAFDLYHSVRFEAVIDAIEGFTAWVRSRDHYPKYRDKADLLERFGLSDLAKRQIGGLSGGQKRRLAVSPAFAGNPHVVFLDEPTTGLDVEARRILWEVIRASTPTAAQRC
ncbi:ATP-binding cassette domain-containing protein [Nonomuraea sp. LPB2021202275-12-8]|uniref:ATP-binding cassette domain-containing protein n=1 Tax=Nonomuraea sp. LPB2021202275-12-8 TaxID=3120159 RepID=UPI00300C5BD9